MIKFLIALVLTPKMGWSAQLLVLKLNEIHSMPVLAQAGIAIEKKSLLTIKDRGREIQILARQEGTSLLRVGDKTWKVVVTSPNTQLQFKFLTELISRTPDLSLDYESDFFRVRGNLDHVSTWLSLAAQRLNRFLLETEVSPQQVKLVQFKLNEVLVKAGFFPIQIHLEPHPCVRLPKGLPKDHQMRELIAQYGIALKEDQQRIYAEPLIRVQVHLLEVRKSLSQQIGIEWPSHLSAQVVPEGVLKFDGSSLINAHFLSQSGKGRILAHPTLLAKSGSEADFFAGGEIPIKTRTKQSQTVLWKKYGISLKISPRVDPDGKISLDLKSEVSSLDSGEKIDGIPSLFTNTLSSHFDLHSSQTIALSGLIKKIGGEALKQWPGIGEVPVLGSLFTSRDYQEDKTELLVLVTPQIVNQDH